MIAVDWGTSNLRAYRMDDAGRVVDHMAASSGITKVAAGAFPATLAEAIGDWLRDGERRVLMCGMVGSRQGWVEAPYLPCPADPAAIAGALVDVPFAAPGIDGVQVKLVPGLSGRDGAGVPEVMRGEETKLVGLIETLGGAGVVCMPGSHTKWARIEGGCIAGFATYFTGEAFAALRGHTILGRMMAPGDDVDPEGFRRGVARSGDPGHLLHHLFGVRALGLFGELDETAASGFLSGLLIGHEVRAAMREVPEVRLLGDATLVGLYEAAIAQCGGRALVVETDVVAAGLALIGEQAGWN
jgi:2-dehydro-3-deoxygalactonokinase